MIFNLDPVIFDFLPTRWYTLMFILGFIVCLWIFDKILKKQGCIEHKGISNNFFFFAVIGTIVGARLGHVFFYSWDYYSQNILEIFMPWKGGLASHGGVVGVFVAVIIFFRIYGKKYRISFWKFLDALIIPTLLMASLIRFGNFCNSEIVGKETHSDKGVLFCGDIYLLCDRSNMPEIYVEKTGEAKDGLIPINCKLVFDKQNENYAQSIFYRLSMNNDPNNFIFSNNIVSEQYKNGKWEYSNSGLGILRYPAQLFECLFYLLLFLISIFTCKFLWKYKGLCFAVFLGLVFLFRFFIEFIKAEQVEAEKFMTLDIGQKLSIPIVIICVAISIWSILKGKIRNKY
jgi:prolipoprotein diacylglyceryl transferase